MDPKSPYSDSGGVKVTEIGVGGFTLDWTLSRRRVPSDLRSVTRTTRTLERVGVTFWFPDGRRRRLRRSGRDGVSSPS